MTSDEQRRLMLAGLSGARRDDLAPGRVRAREQAGRTDDLTRHT
ncbi:hypothetical protein EDD28_1211 [Salana multivorans]|uniref:Uncharacterized protein n=1 Tax=Salana multivorans TaxID=120377 RepID=A0A3N2D9Z3_9MICO|nr:hypothetical protein [Salana multivorans]ROR96625.1 hypothetical protein EDD28_1211 [Salana multivorans]